MKKLYSGLERGDVERFLLKQPTFTRNKPRRSHFPRRRTIKKGVFNQLSCDLMDLQSLKTKNKNYSFILVMLDIVSHFLVAIPLKTKSKQSMMDAFEFDDGLAGAKTVMDLAKVEWLDDSLEQMSNFAQVWDHVLRNLSDCYLLCLNYNAL